MNKSNQIAIIGMGCRFPGGADSAQQLWENAKKGIDGICDVPQNRWDVRKYYSENRKKPGKAHARQGGFVNQRLDTFDPLFFNISPKEAEVVDPMQRLLLEVSWEALEDAGITTEEVKAVKTGVFVGGFAIDNKAIHLDSQNIYNIDSTTPFGVTHALLSNRLSYVYDLTGPSMSVDTACSASMTALHFAVQSLRQGDCDMAMVGGANTMMTPHYPITMSKGQFLSHHSRCKAFDADAAGYVRAEGAAILLLKPLEKALADGDDIHAVICETGANQDGQTTGISLPNPEAQEALLRQVYGKAGVDASELSYIEAHGTGTKAGDPLEIKAISAVLSDRSKDDPCLVGSIKTNIGHSEAASGVAGLIKAAMTARDKVVAPNLHFNNPNPEIPFDSLPVKIPTEIHELDQSRTHFVGINSFGYGGSNAHALLRSLDADEKVRCNKQHERTTDLVDGPYIVPVSAKSEKALYQVVERLLDFLESPARDDDPVSLSDVIYTLSQKRDVLNIRHGFVVSSLDDLIDKLANYLDEQPNDADADGVAHQKHQGVNLVCTGMGPQWWGMGRGLYQSNRIFRETVERCDEVFTEIAGWSIKEELLKDEADSRMHETQVAQPANFVIQVAVYEVLRSYGVKPLSVVGHSVGEVSAAYISGALSLEDACKVSYHRSRLQQTCSTANGGMLAIGCSVEDFAAWQEQYPEIEIAAINGETTITVAGDKGQLEELEKKITETGTFARLLAVEIAYHSQYMDPIKDDIFAALADIKPHTTELPLVSTVTGELIEGEKLDAQYWWQNVRQAVLFADGFQSLLKQNDAPVMEIGPHPVLKSSIQEGLTIAEDSRPQLASLNRKEDDNVHFFKQLASYVCQGGELNWQAQFDAQARFVRLPHYPWQRDTYWRESRMSIEKRLGLAGFLYLNERVDRINPTWQLELNPYLVPYLNDHKVHNTVVYPGAGLIDSMVCAATEATGQSNMTLEGIKIENMLTVDDDQVTRMETSFDLATQRLSVAVRNIADDNDNWKPIASAKLLSQSLDAPALDVDAIEAQCTKPYDVETFYTQCRDAGLDYGHYFQTIRDIKVSDDAVLAKVTCVEEVLNEVDQYRVHPTLLDAAFQSLLTVTGLEKAYIPVEIKQLTLLKESANAGYVYAVKRKQSERSIHCDIYLFDENRQPIVYVEGLLCMAVDSGSQSDEVVNPHNYHYEWQALAAQKDRNVVTLPMAILCDGSVLSQAVKEKAADLGVQALVLEAGESYKKHGFSHFVVNSQDESSIKKALENCPFVEPSLVIDLWSSNLDTATVFDAQQVSEHAYALRNLVESLKTQYPERQMELIKVTRNGQVNELEVESGANFNFSASALAGLAPSVVNEYPYILCKSLDFGQVTQEQLLEALFAECEDGRNETEIRVNGDSRYVRRIVATSSELDNDETIVVSTDNLVGLVQAENGRLDSLAYELLERTSPAEDEVEIRVHASAVNGKDVLKLTGRIAESVTENTFSGEAFGIEVSGVVTHAGANTQWQEGDEVVAFYNQGAYRSYITTKDQFIVKKPAHLSFADSTNYMGYVTAYQGLIRLAQLASNENVLIHNAADDVGLAAIHIAKSVGANIFATADSQEKREFLKSQGVEQVFDSRSLAFYQAIRTATNGYGVDVVLNARDGDALHKSVELLAPFGRFVEIGKKDISDNSALAMRSFNENLQFNSLDIERLMVQKPDYFQALMEEVSNFLNNNTDFTAPSKSFPASQTQQALEFAEQAEQVGKVVIDYSSQELSVIKPQERHWLTAQSTYLISGGTAGFGLRLAEQFATWGVKRLVLISRSGRIADTDLAVLEHMQSLGCDVVTRSVDITDEAAINALVSEINDVDLPLKGIIHSAAVLDDDNLSGLNVARFNRVLAPKALGAMYLHNASLQLDSAQIETFVMFSSLSSIIGNPGQANYIAANAFLNSLAQYRQAKGLAATTINWGALAESGMVARDQTVKQILAEQGVYGISNAYAFTQFDAALEARKVMCGIMDVEWPLWFNVNPPSKGSARFSLLLEQFAQADDDSPAQLFQNSLIQLPQPERKALLVERLKEQIAELLKYPIDQMDSKVSITSLGVDSLTTHELSKRIFVNLGLSVSGMVLLSGPSIEQLAKQQLDEQFADVA
ncbi:SDR family NAD(P)-dependent oxidoreductase [Pseudoalteromonas sp. T1lg65]|uniref:SDR family NAD(P)-dependent oxidoreductase n=1 Tax=Pseudoalteromonas sp. T1lg65 TaxID=2077101 RepID=UPI003F79F3D6